MGVRVQRLLVVAAKRKSKYGSQHLMDESKREAERYAILSPLSVNESFHLSHLAIQFFSPLNNRGNAAVIGKQEGGPLTPLSSMDFVCYLEKTGGIDAPMKRIHQIFLLLKKLAASNILTNIGNNRGAYQGNYYFFDKELTNREQCGFHWLAPALGPEFVYEFFSSVIVQIVGKNNAGDEIAGTGIIIADNIILTCAHVLRDMTVSQKQRIQSQEITVEKILTHESIDVGLLRVNGQLHGVQHVSFSQAKVGETVFTLGFPRVPFSIDASPIMHRGEVSSHPITTFDHQELFLYSAISRPGNSGCPIISETGRISGICTKELSEDSVSAPATPFFAGIPVKEITRAIKDIAPSVAVPLEDFS